MMRRNSNLVVLHAEHFSASFLCMEIRMHIDTLRERLRSCAATREQIAAATGGSLSSSWVSKFASGRMRNPRVESLIALEQAINAHSAPVD
jgi:transcriptional regulator with XRE-family HTH domain